MDTVKERIFSSGSKRRELFPELKGEAVKLVINTGRLVAVVSRELGIVTRTGYRHAACLVWCAKDRIRC